jgi:hypothetical protein
MKVRRLLLLGALGAGLLTLGATRLGGTAAATASDCQLNSPKGNVKHVIYIQFDNTHFRRDNPNVASDLEQMPHLLNFLTGNGTLLTNDHTVLISHTAGGILSSLTGLYPDRNGQGVSNSYGYFRPNGTVGFSSSFKYWTDQTDGGNPANTPPTPSADSSYNMLNADSVALGGTGAARNAPAPWVPFTRVGCDVGNVGTANAVLENNNSIIFRTTSPGSPNPTTLAAAAASGATNIKVVSTSGFAAGQTFWIDVGAGAEQATVAVGGVGTAGSGGTGITLTAPLTNGHLTGVAIYGLNATDPTGDMTKVFGENSPEWNEGKTSQIAPSGTAARTLAQTDFVGIAIHCAAGGGICNDNAANAKPDPLPDEAGGYGAFQALFGAKYVDPAITKDAAHPSGTPSVNDTSGNPVADPFGQFGFPGFDGMFAKNTLGYVAQMQEAGIPVTFAYISDAHDNHGNSGNIHIAYGPGEAGYVQQLHDYDQAFADFFARLAADGITKENTLFVVTVEEEDHFAGTAPDGPCDGVTVPCTYANGHVTEVNGDLKRLVATYNASNGTSATTDFSVHSDMAPNVYITGQPAPDVAITRNLERAMSDMEVTNPLTGQKQDLFIAMADPIEEKTLHMVTADPARTPTFTPFAQGDYFLSAAAGSPATCAGNNLDNCVFIPGPGTPGFNPNQTFAWNHGGIQPEIASTWIGLVGPGVEVNGMDSTTWSDHTDLRPTILSLLGLEDSYVLDGRLLLEDLSGYAIPDAVKTSVRFRQLVALYKQLNAPFGQFAMDTLKASTKALASNDPGDTTYTSIENQIQTLTSQRDTLAGQIRSAIDGATFDGQAITNQQSSSFISQGQNLLAQAQALPH